MTGGEFTGEGLTGGLLGINELLEERSTLVGEELVCDG